MPTRTAALLLLITCLASFGSARPAVPGTARDSQWHWLWLTPSNGGWETIRGDAEIKFWRGTFHAVLKGHGEGYDPTLIVDGNIDQSRVEAMVSQDGTDASARRYVGTMRSTRTKLSDPSRGASDNRIMLKEHDFVLGFYRNFDAVEHPVGKIPE